MIAAVSSSPKVVLNLSILFKEAGWLLICFLQSLPAIAQPAAQPPPPASSTPIAVVQAAATLTHLTYEDREAWRKVLQWSAECEQAFDYPDKSFGGLEFYPLADKQYLVEVVCTTGAYQGYQVYYFYDETKQQPVAKLLTFESRESQDEKSLTKIQTTELWGLPTFDTNTKELKVFNKFRGIGDCGTLATYEFIDGQPKLKELRAKLACDGKGTGDPEQWTRISLQ
jgi:hypothetical protein